MKIYSEYSFWWIGIAVLFSLLIAFIQYHYKIKSSVFSKTTRRILFVIRAILLFIICILLLNFYSKFLKKEYIKPVLVLAIDNSQSMIKAKDSAEVKKFFSEKIKELKSSLQDKYDIQTITFGQKISFNNDSINFKELKTNPENIFGETQQILGNKPISAMLMITDGIFNEGVHPVSLAGNLNYPVYVLATGDTAIYKDIRIKKILCNKNVFIGNDFVVQIFIQSSAVYNEKTNIAIYDGKEQIAQKEITINEKNDLSEVQFQLNAAKGGYHTFKVTASPVSNEKNTQNNTAYFVVNVIENKTKIAILYASPHPDISAIRQSLNTSPQYETEVYDDDLFTKEITKYDLVIYHSPLPNSPVFEKCLRSNTPMFIISPQLPAVQNKLLAVKQYLPQYNEIEAQYNSSFSAFSLNDEYAEMVNHLPVITAPYGNYFPIGESDVLYYQKINNIITGLPLLFYTSSAGGTKYALFLGDGLWRWKMTNYQIKQNTDWFNHLITQTIRYLSVKRDKSPFKVMVPPTINENEPLQVTAEFYNEAMQMITDPDVFLKLYDESNNEYKYVFNKSSSNYFLNAGILPPGEYRYTAHTQYKGREYSQSGKLHIVPVFIETNNLTAQHHLLKVLATKTGGKFYLLKDTDQCLNDLMANNDAKTILIENETYQYWIDNQYWFILLLCLSFAEWMIRRWNGVV
ncbi:MAG: hypothetical protein KatS3mg028_0499 [Bacteroidia bacterium]|nr:MAG: hypothetical protein KatS3mg028_0499 [Bacteroidia bacterium]